MKSRRSFSAALGVATLAMALSGCASKAPQDKSAAEAMNAQRTAPAAGYPYACYDEFGTMRGDAPYAYCHDQPRYYVVQERRATPVQDAAAAAAPSSPVQDATAEQPGSTVLRPSARSQPLPRPGIQTMRLPVPVGGGIGILR